jgi:hypothetical protein
MTGSPHFGSFNVGKKAGAYYMIGIEETTTERQASDRGIKG